MSEGMEKAPERQQAAGSVVGSAAARRRMSDRGQRRGGPLAILLVSLFVELIWLAGVGYLLYRVL